MRLGQRGALDFHGRLVLLPVHGLAKGGCRQAFLIKGHLEPVEQQAVNRRDACPFVDPARKRKCVVAPRAMYPDRFRWRNMSGIGYYRGHGRRRLLDVLVERRSDSAYAHIGLVFKMFPIRRHSFTLPLVSLFLRNNVSYYDEKALLRYSATYLSNGTDYLIAVYTID